MFIILLEDPTMTCVVASLQLPPDFNLKSPHMPPRTCLDAMYPYKVLKTFGHKTASQCHRFSTIHNSGDSVLLSVTILIFTPNPPWVFVYFYVILSYILARVKVPVVLSKIPARLWLDEKSFLWNGFQTFFLALRWKMIVHSETLKCYHLLKMFVSLNIVHTVYWGKYTHVLFQAGSFQLYIFWNFLIIALKVNMGIFRSEDFFILFYF